jgi:glycosyltransferase involved in cell wall biosynthesis
MNLSVFSYSGKEDVPALQDDARAAGRGNRPIKILVLIPSLEIGGAEMDLVRNLPNLDRSRFVPVVCALSGQATLSAQLRNAGVDVIALNWEASSGKGFYDGLFGAVEHSCRYVVSILPDFVFTRFLAAGERYFRTARSVAHYIDETDVDVVHSILPSSYLIAMLANMLTKRRPLVMSRLSQNWYQQEIPMLGMIERWWLHRQVDIAIGNSQPVLEELRAEGIPDHKLLLLHNGIDTLKFADQMLDSRAARDQLAIPQDALVLTCVGNLYARKGHADLLSALCLVKDQLPPNWLLLAAGRDVEGNLAKLGQLAEELGLSQHIRLLGERCDIPVILSAADIHISASWYESFPNNILEAMAAAVPVVATAVGGVPEQIVDGLTGLLVPARNPEALAEAIITLARDFDRREVMGRAARKRVELEFPIIHSVSALERVYERLGGRCTSLNVPFPVEFIDENGGPGVRLRKRHQKKG